jgi:hypothetical protein
MVPLYANGRELLTYYPHVPCGSDVGISVAISSYNQNLYYGVTYDLQAAPDGELFRDLLVEAWEELRDAAGVRSMPAAPPGERRPTAPAADLRAHRQPEPQPPPEAQPVPEPVVVAAASADAEPAPEPVPHERAVVRTAAVAGTEQQEPEPAATPAAVAQPVDFPLALPGTKAVEEKPSKRKPAGRKTATRATPAVRSAPAVEKQKKAPAAAPTAQMLADKKLPDHPGKRKRRKASRATVSAR